MTSYVSAQNITKSNLIQLKGTISNYPIKMNLSSVNRLYTGVYYYEKIQQPIGLSGTSINRGNKIELKAYINEKEEKFNLSKNGNVYTGTWTGSDSRPPLPVKLTVDNSGMPFEIYQLEDSLKLLPNSENSSTAKFSTSVIWPLDKNALGNLVKGSIAKMLSYNLNGGNIKKGIIDARDNYFKEYKDNNKKLSTETNQEPSLTYNAELTQSVSVKFESSEIISLEYDEYIYDGGAHGLFGSVFVNIDKLKSKLISVNDVIVNPSSKQLLRILEKRYRLQHGVTLNTNLTEIGLFDNQIPKLAENFYLTNKGIGFCYDLYEIGPYVAGAIQIFVPFKDLNGMLTTEFQKFAQ